MDPRLTGGRRFKGILEAEIRARGYADFEQIFHDLAGFDISRGRGVEWSTLFMRGIRTENTDRFLMIRDGTLSAFNVANRTYYDPGLREADGKKYNGAILQPGANGSLIVTYRF